MNESKEMNEENVTQDSPSTPGHPGTQPQPVHEQAATEPQTRDPHLLSAAIEGLLFVHSQPLTLQTLSEFLQIPPEEVEKLIREKKDAMDSDPRSGLQVVINEQGIQLATKAMVAPFIQRMDGQKLVNLSLPALETLSVIAFKQPITRAEIENIRGVNCDGVISTLLEKKLIYVSGEKAVIGRPRLYSTTQDFLYYFGLKSLKELPIPTVDTSEATPQVSAEGMVPEALAVVAPEEAPQSVPEEGGAGPQPETAPAGPPPVAEPAPREEPPA